MPDHVALFEGDEFTLTASDTIVGGQVLEITGDGTCAPTSDESAAWIGVAGFDVESGDLVTVLYEGIHVLTASGAINAGDNVVSDSDGKVQTLAAASGTGASVGDVNDARSVIGVAITSSSTDGDPVTIRLAR